MTRPRLLILINRLVIGGHIFDTIPLTYRLKDDFEILFVYGERKPDEIEASFLLTKYPGIKVHKISSLKRSLNPFKDVDAFVGIDKIVKEFKPDILHTHGAKPGLIGRLVGWKHKVPVVIHTYHGHFFHSYFNAFLTTPLIWLERWLSRFSTKIIATSHQQWDDLVKKYKIAPAEKVETIYLGIDEKMFTPSAENSVSAFRKEYQLTDETVAIGIVARIAKIKNFDLFADVVKLLLKTTTTPVKFFVIGDGALKPYVQQLLDERQIKWCNKENFVSTVPVVFTSWISEIEDAINGLDIVILTSNNEGTALSLVEAQLCGKPVVATNVGGVRDTLVDKVTGFFAEAGNAEDFVSKLKVLVEDKSLREKMGEAGICFAKKRFSKDEEVKILKHLYTSLLREALHKKGN
jgi:glycosyltransferase involved in cell wall biosynthesis